MIKKIAVTNRKLCRIDLIEQIKKIASDDYYDAIILREKDLNEQEYFVLAEKIQKICAGNKIFIINHFIDTAICLKTSYFQTSFSDIDKISELHKTIKNIGISVHSVDEAEMAEKCGADFLIAGHIFETDCKKGLKPRGLDFLENICRNVEIPVFAIGGIDKNRYDLIEKAGAAGGCEMSAAMKL